MRICLDAGHGGKDPGAVGTKTNEKSINLAFVLALGEELTKAGHTVSFTRKNDVWLDLEPRTAIADDNEADFFLSVHTNAFGNPQAIGYESYVRPNDNNPFYDVLHRNIAKATGLRDRGLKVANWGVLLNKNINRPSMLIELGFITNQMEEELMISTIWIKSVVNAIVQTFGVSNSELDKAKAWKLANKLTDDEILLDYYRMKGSPVVSKQKYEKFRKFNSTVHVYRAGFNVDLELGQYQKLERLSDIAKSKGAVAGINCGFFGWDGKVENLGMVIDNGKYYTPPHKDFINFIYFKDKTVEINNLYGYDGKYLSDLQKTTNWAIGTSYSLVKDGKPFITNTAPHPHATQRHPRTLLGYGKDGFIFVVVEGRRTGETGITAIESATILTELGCTHGVNLDGGGSSALYIEGKIMNKPSDGTERKVGSVLLAY